MDLSDLYDTGDKAVLLVGHERIGLQLFAVDDFTMPRLGGVAVWATTPAATSSREQHSDGNMSALAEQMARHTHVHTGEIIQTRGTPC